jgi:hypothetical protein
MEVVLKVLDDPEFCGWSKESLTRRREGAKKKGAGSSSRLVLNPRGARVREIPAAKRKTRRRLALFLLRAFA